MTYDLNDPRDYNDAVQAVQRMRESKAVVELSVITEDYDAITGIMQAAAIHHIEISMQKKRRPKTDSQNRYIYFLCDYFATEYGCTKVEAKEIYLKRQACPDIFRTEKVNKAGQTIHTYRSVASLSVTEASSVIRNFIAWAEIGHIALPLPEDRAFVKYAQRQIMRNAHNI